MRGTSFWVSVLETTLDDKLGVKLDVLARLSVRLGA